MKHSAEFKSMCQPWRVEAHPRGWFVTNGVVSFIHGFECNANEHLKQLQSNPDMDQRGFLKDDSD